MNILEALKSPDTYDVRVTHGERWLYWDDADHEWVVRGQPHPRMRNKVLIVTADEAEAVAVLLGQEQAT